MSRFLPENLTENPHLFRSEKKRYDAKKTQPALELTLFISKQHVRAHEPKFILQALSRGESQIIRHGFAVHRNHGQPFRGPPLESDIFDPGLCTGTKASFRMRVGVHRTAEGVVRSLMLLFAERLFHPLF